MGLKKLFVNFILVLFSIYLPLLFFSFVEYITSIRKLENNNQINEINQKIDATKEGFLPNYYPSTLFGENKDIKFYPLGSLPFTKTFYCDEGYGLVKYKSDRFGLRNYDRKWSNIHKKKNIFFIGDSFVNGACVSEEFTIPNLIESKTNLNTINLGVPGNGPYEYKAIMQFLLKPILEKSEKKPLVFLVFYKNDMHNFNFLKDKLLKNSLPIVYFSNSDEFYPTTKYQRNIKSFITTNYATEEKEIIEKIRKNAFKHSSLYQVGTLFFLRQKFSFFISNYIIKDKEINNSANNKVSKETIKYFSNMCLKLCKPHIVYIPNSDSWEPDIRAKNYKKTLKETSLKYGISFLDGEKVINSSDLNNYAPFGGHLSKEGYKKISNFILEEIK